MAASGSDGRHLGHSVTVIGLSFFFFSVQSTFFLKGHLKAVFSLLQSQLY